MTKADQSLLDIVDEGQSGKFKHFVRQFTGHITQLVKLKNPLESSLLVDDIDYILEIINPELQAEIAWFNKLKIAIKLWHNEKVITNRLLGLKDDNQYDTREFEKVVMEKFFLSEKEKPKYTDFIKTEFKNLIELVELGARRFGQ